MVEMNDGIDVVLQGVEADWERGYFGKRVGSPNIVVGRFGDSARLAQCEIVGTHRVEKNVEGTAYNPVHAGMKKLRWDGSKFLDQDTQRVRRIQALQAGNPERGELLIGGGCQTRALQFPHEFLVRIIGEANVGGEKLLVKNRGFQESRDLLPFNGIARQGED